MRMSAVVVNRVLPELFGQREEEIFEQLRAARRPSACSRSGRAAPVAPVLEAARLAVTMRRTRSAHLQRLQAGLPEGLPVLLLPVPVRPQLRRPHHAPGGPRAGRGAGAVTTARAPPAKTVGQLLAAKDIVIACGPGGVGKTTTAAALAATAVVEQGGRVLVLTVDPARRLADALGLKGIGNDEVRIPDEVFTEAAARPRGELWAAMLDTKQSWDDLIRTPRARRRDAGADPRQPAVPEHLGPLRPVARLHRHGAALRDPLRGQVRPHRRRHAADAQRARLPRRAAAHGRLLLVAAAALAHRALPVAAGEHGVAALLPGGRPHPRHAVPGRHLRVLHPVPVDVRRLRRAGRGGDAAAVGPAHDVHGRVDARGHAGARGRVLLGRAHGAQAAPRRGRAEQGAARVPARRQDRQAGPVDRRPGRRAGRRA